MSWHWVATPRPLDRRQGGARRAEGNRHSNRSASTTTRHPPHLTCAACTARLARSRPRPSTTVSPWDRSRSSSRRGDLAPALHRPQAARAPPRTKALAMTTRCCSASRRTDPRRTRLRSEALGFRRPCGWLAQQPSRQLSVLLWALRSSAAGMTDPISPGRAVAPPREMLSFSCTALAVVVQASSSPPGATGQTDPRPPGRRFNLAGAAVPTAGRVLVPRRHFGC